MTAEKELLHRDLTKEIIDSVFKVHNALGCGLLKKIYSKALIWDLELKKRKSQLRRSMMYIAPRR